MKKDKKKLRVEKQKEQQQKKLVEEWKAHNKSMKASGIKPISLDAYIKKLYGGRRIGLKGVAPYKITIPAWASTTDHIKSLQTNKPSPTKSSIMNDVEMGRLSEQDSALVLNKASRIGLSTSKGAYTYITDETDLKTLGKKTQSLK